jgi:hypothetical protein
MRGGLIAFIPVWVIVLVLGISLWVRAGMPVPGPPPPNGNATAYEPACVPSDNPAQLTLCDSGSTVRAPVHSWVRTQLFQPCMEWADAQSRLPTQGKHAPPRQYHERQICNTGGDRRHPNRDPVPVECR